MVDVSFNLKSFEYFLLILVRISAFIYVAPFFGQKGIPNQVKIGVAVVCSILMAGVVDKPELTYAGVLGYAVLVVKETITGLMIGFACVICNAIVLFAGNIIDMDIGLSMATEFNPDTNTESTISGTMYYYFIMLLLIASNMHTYILRAICDSFQVVPIVGANFNWDSLLSTMIRYMMNLSIIGFRIFLPYFAVIMVMNVLLGIMAKVAPQMNMFSVGIQLKLLAGFTVMFLTIFMLPNIADYIFAEMKELVVLVIEGMS